MKTTFLVLSFFLLSLGGNYALAEDSGNKGSFEAPKKAEKKKKDNVYRGKDLPWQPASMTKKARKNFRKGTPNPNKSNFSKWQQTRLYYKIKARKAQKKAVYNKAEAPKHKEYNRKKTIRQNKPKRRK